MAKKQHRLDVIWKKILEKKNREFKKLKADYEKLTRENAGRIDDIQELERLGVDFGTPSWKAQVTRHDGSRKEYLRILSPNGGNKYIGCKPDAVSKALADIERGKKHQSLSRLKMECDSDMESIVDQIESLLENSSYY